MKRTAIIATFAILILGCISCEKVPSAEYDDPASNPFKELSLSTKATGYAHTGNTFAFNFLDKVNASTDGDFIISPLSMQFLLGMLLDGAKGQTADEICNVLGYGAGEVDDVNEYCLYMLQNLPDLDRKTQLAIANAIVVNQKFSLLDSYKTSASKFYEAEVSNADFSDAAGTAKKINKWCSKQTKGLVPEIIEAKDVKPSALAFLMNAVYFKSQWAEGMKFPKSDTKAEQFTREDGTTKKVQMMKNEKEYQYQGNDIFTAVKIPYGNMVYSMTVILPDEGHTIQETVESLKGLDWMDFTRSMVRCTADIWLPRFETDFSIELTDILSSMGMPTAFGAADFTAMSKDALNLSMVKQNAAIKVDEEGTEAAAVSIAGVRYGSAGIPDSHIVFHADRPFLYVISEWSSGAILFVGKYSGK